MTASQTELRALMRLAENSFSGPALFTGRGAIPTNGIGDGNDFLEFASYCDGDDVRLIDWRATAKSKRPMIRRHRARAASQWTILVDCSASMRFGHRWQVACDLASAFAALLLQQSHRVGLIMFDSRMRASVPAKSGALHLYEINAALDRTPAGPDGKGGSLLCALRHLARPSGVVVLSDLLWGQDVEPAIRACMNVGGQAHILRLAAPEDTQIPVQARGLVDAETGQTRMLSDTAQNRNLQSQRNLDALETRAAQASRAVGAVYSSFAVEAGWKSAITAHLRRSARSHA